MNPELLELLLQATSSGALLELIDQYKLNITTIQALKEQMESFQTTDLGEVMRIAQLAERLSHLMPRPAPLLGRWTLANALFYTNRYREAAQIYEQVRSAYLADGYALDAARMSVGQVFVLAYIGEGERAIALAHEIEPLLVEAGQMNAKDRQRLGSLLMNTGVAYELLGRFEETLGLYDRLIPLVVQQKDQLMLGQVIHNRAYALVQIGALDEARQAYAQAEALFLETDARVELFRLYMNLTSLLGSLERYTEAQQIYEKAESLLANLSEANQQRHELTLLWAWVALNNRVQAEAVSLPALLAARQAFELNHNVIGAGLTLIALGRYYLSVAAPENAYTSFAQAHQLALQSADRSLTYRALHGLGQVAETQQQTDRAIEAYTAALYEIEAMRQELRIEIFRANFLIDKLVVYQDLARLYLHLHQQEAAFQVIERSKARLLTEKLAFLLKLEAAQLGKVAPEAVYPLIEQLNRTLHQLEEHYRQVRQANFQADGNLTDTVGAETRTAIAELEQQVQTLTRTIQRQQPLFSPLATAEPVSLAHLQTCLADETLFYYYILHGEVGVFVCNQLGIQANVWLGPWAAIKTAQQALLTAIERMLELSVQFGSTRAKRHLPALLNDANKQLHLLYQQLIQPLAVHLAATPALLIVPDGALHTLPFHALFDGAHYLVEQHVLSIAPSASVLDFCRRPSLTQTPHILLMGYDNERLGSVTTEMQTLAQILPTADTVVDQAATTAYFLANAAAYSVLHLATHAQFRIDDPLLSSLSLADRRLTLAEIARLQLNADLVVLNGCETGRGQLHGGDLLSLASGFLGAGARSLLVSLWRVEDQVAAELMTHFYRALLSGQSRAQALRTAQLAILNQGRQPTGQNSLYAHPAFWAPFTLIGNSQGLPQFQPA